MPASWTSRGTVLIRLARQHFAFYRGYLDGLDVRLLAERYPGGAIMEGDDGLVGPSGKALLGWISQQLLVEAERCGQRSAARLLRIRPLQAAAGKQHGNLPTLAEFQEERDPYHMYSEEELLELFEQQYGGRSGGSDRIAERGLRLRQRQEALLQLIESRSRLEPSLDDPVSAWIDRGLANYLMKAGIVDLCQLFATIEAHGFHWYRKVPRIGIRAARHITSWLLLPSTREALGVALSVRGVTPPRQIQSDKLGPPARGLDVLPLERLSLPDALNGMAGANRGMTASCAGENDIEAVHAWLLEMKPGSHTGRACRKEAERFLLWSVLEKGKPLSSVDAADGQAYAQFLSDIGRQSPEAWARKHRIPQERWLGPRGIDRWSVRWRPFEGPLSVTSQRAALSLLKSLTRFLCASAYLRTDPLLEVRVSASAATDTSHGVSGRKVVSEDEWAAALTYLRKQPSSPRRERISVILLLLKETGCRLQQLASLRRDALSWNGNGWCLQISAENLSEQTILISKELLGTLIGLYRFHGFEDFNSVPSSFPLIAAMPGDTGTRSAVRALTGSRIYRIIKDYFEMVADSVKDNQADLAGRLRQISPDSFLCRN
jgi:integrase